MDLRLILALAAVGILTALAAWWLLRGARPNTAAATAELPQLWGLQPRACFTVAERRLFGWVKGAFPAHIVLVKVPLTRYMMPVQRDEANYWYGLLGPLYTTFVICEGNGRVIAAIDIADHQRGGLSRRALYIKRSALRACGVRYIALQTGAMPSLSRLRELVLGEVGAQMMLGDRPSEDMRRARENLSTKVRDRRADRQRSTFQDSTLDSRFDMPSELGLDSRFDAHVEAAPLRSPRPGSARDSGFGRSSASPLGSRFDSRFDSGFNEALDSRLDAHLDSRPPSSASSAPRASPGRDGSTGPASVDVRLDALLDSRLGQGASRPGALGDTPGPNSRSGPRTRPPAVVPETTWTWPAPLDALPADQDPAGRGPTQRLDGEQVSRAIRELRERQAGARALRLDSGHGAGPDSGQDSRPSGGDTRPPGGGRVDISL